jgi:hypothetical protein
LVLCIVSVTLGDCPKVAGHSIEKLPGVDMKDLCSYAGLIEVNKDNEGQLFYWLFRN